MKKRMRRTVSVLLLAVALLITQIPTAEVVADTAAASDFQMNGSTLVRYLGTASSVSIPATVLRIGEEAFAENTTIRSVYFQGALESIGYRAFAGCDRLEKIELPDTVVSIDNGAFSDCQALTSITLGRDLESLGTGVFAGSSKLQEIKIAEGNTHFVVEDGALYNTEMDHLYAMLPVRERETYNMPATVTGISPYAFWGSNIKNLSLSHNLKEIPSYAFSNAKSLQGISIPYSVTTIQSKAFEDCVNLEVTSIPASVNSIHLTAFDGCPKLKIVADMGTVADTYYQAWLIRWAEQIAEYEDTGNEDWEDEDGTGSAGGNGTGNTGSDSLAQGQVLGQSHVVGNRAVVFIDNSASHVYGAVDPETQNGAGENTSGEGQDQSTEDLLENQEGKKYSIPKYTVTGTIIADQAYYKSQEIATYEIPEGIEEIGSFTFARSNLTEISIPAGVTTIGYGAFYHCDSLRNVTIPSTVTTIEPKAFSHSLWLKNWMAGSTEDFLVVGDGILLAYSGSDLIVNIPETVRIIAPEVFADHREIQQVVLPGSLREIGEAAFLGCTSLQRVSGGEFVTKIADRAFEGCPLITFHIPETVKELGLLAVDYSETSKSISSKVAVFAHTETLPVLSYEESATRLSAADYRGSALGDTLIAVVDRHMKVEDLAGTVLDPKENGFSGVVAAITSYSAQEMTIISCNMTAEEASRIYLPEYVFVDGTAYLLLGKDKVESLATGEETTEGFGVRVLMPESLSQEGTGLVSASLEGDVGDYYLQLRELAVEETAFSQAYRQVYGQELSSQSRVFSLTLTEVSTGVEIGKLGNNALEVLLPREWVKGNGSLRGLTLDENGQLEAVTISETGDDRVRLVLDHMGEVAVFATNVSAGNLDDSPDTGELIHPKWFFATGVLFLALGMFFYKPRKKQKK